MLSDHRPVLSVCLSCLSFLSLALVYCGQTVGRIKIKLGVQVDLCHGHTVIDGDPAPLPKRGTTPQFSAHIRGGQTARKMKIKMPLGMEVGFSPGDFVLDGDSAPHKKGGTAPNFRPMSIVAKRLDGSRCHLVRGRPRPRRLCIRWEPSCPSKGWGTVP